MGCCGRFKEELFSLQWFSLHDVNGKTVDIERSFAPKPKSLVAVYKLFVTIVAYDVFMREAIDLKGDMLYYFIFMTHWAFLAALIYLPSSLAITLFDYAKQPVGSAPCFIVRFVWVLFSICVTLQVIVTILFWVLEYDPAVSGIPDYFVIIKHGGLMILIFIEGLIVNKIPVRAKHMAFVEAIGLLFCFWTIVHSLLEIGNPFRVNTPHDDDIIYNVIDWKDMPKETFQIYVGVLFVAIPVLFTIVWSLSLCGRRYLDYESIDMYV